MRDDATVLDRFLTACDAFEQGHSSLLLLEGFDIHEIGARQSMLRDQDRLLVAFQLGQELGGLALEGRDECGTHAVILK